MSVRRFANPDQFTLTSPELQTVPSGGAVGFLGVKFHQGLGVCCGDTASNCAYDIDPAALTAVTAITFKNAAGVNTTVTFASVSTDKAIRVAIAKAFMDNGIDPYYNGDEFKGITIVGQRLRIISTVEIVSAVVNGVTTNFTKKCTFSAQCTYKIAFEYDADPLKLSDVAAGGTQIGTTDGYADGASLVTIAGAVETALVAEGFVIAQDAVAVNNASAGAFEVTFVVLGTGAVYYNGASLQSQKCNQTFIA
jgi:hypothetical protein